MAETEEGLWMSAKERDRLKVLHEVRKRHITQRQAAAELGISVRWVGTLLKRLRVHGDRGLRHRLRAFCASTAGYLFCFWNKLRNFSLDSVSGIKCRLWRAGHPSAQAFHK